MLENKLLQRKKKTPKRDKQLLPIARSASSPRREPLWQPSADKLKRRLLSRRRKLQPPKKLKSRKC